MLGKLFMTEGGKIPFTQIALGIIIGAIAMYVYIKFNKGKLPFSKASAPNLPLDADILEPLAAPPLPMSKTLKKVQSQVAEPPKRVFRVSTMIPVAVSNPQLDDEEEHEEEEELPEDNGFLDDDDDDKFNEED